MKNLQSKQGGFTILELMIATVVFSTVLVVVTSGVIYFSKQYYKGVVQSKTQTTARTVINSLAQAIQFGGSTFVDQSANGYYCIGAKRISFVMDRTISNSPTASESYHALVVDTPAACNQAKPNIASQSSLNDDDAQELLGLNMRLEGLTITPAGNGIFTLSVAIAYGEDEPGLVNGDGFSATCKSGAGSQFCAMSVLSTTIQRRLDTN